MTITTDNYEHFCYLYAEGQLSEVERTEVEAFLSEHLDLAEEAALYDAALRLEDENVCFEDKALLRPHRTMVRPIWRWSVAAGVAALLAVGLLVLNPVPHRVAFSPKLLVAENRIPALALAPAEPSAACCEKNVCTAISSSASAPEQIGHGEEAICVSACIAKEAAQPQMMNFHEASGFAEGVHSGYAEPDASQMAEAVGAFAEDSAVLVEPVPQFFLTVVAESNPTPEYVQRCQFFFRRCGDLLRGKVLRAEASWRTFVDQQHQRGEALISQNVDDFQGRFYY